MDDLGKEDFELPRSQQISMVQHLRSRHAGGILDRRMVRIGQSAASAYFRPTPQSNLESPTFSGSPILATGRLLRNSGSTTQRVLPVHKPVQQDNGRLSSDLDQQGRTQFRQI